MSNKTLCIVWAVICGLNAITTLINAGEDWKRLGKLGRILRLNTPLVFVWLTIFLWALADRVR